ncbi:MAG TPA: hypothetical protein VIN58_19235 [Roseateles sp.]
MKAIFFLIACPLVPAILTFAHQVWLLRRELLAPAHAGGMTVECRGSALYGFIGGAWSMFFGGILWSMYQSGSAAFEKVGLLLGALTALSVLLVWLYLITKVTADGLGVRQRGALGWWRSAAWTQIVGVDHTSQPRGWFRLHTASGRVIRVPPDLTHMPQLSAMILSCTLEGVVAPDTHDLLRRSALGEKIGIEHLNRRLYVGAGPRLRLAGGLALVGLVCGTVAWYGYAHEAQALQWTGLEIVRDLRQAAMSFALMFILWSLGFAASAAVTTFKLALQRRREAAAGPSGAAQIH